MDVLNYVLENLKKQQFTLLMLTPAGSRLYGTATPESDYDYRGVFVPSIDYFFGLKNVEEIDLTNKQQGVDIKLYSLKKFAKLAIQNNPNIIELLFTGSNAIYKSEYFTTLEDIAEDFINTNLFHRFFGYAHAQLKKSRIKVDNYNTMLNVAKRLRQYNDDKALVIEYYYKDDNLKKYFTKDKKYIKIGRRQFQANIPIKKLLKYLNETIAAASKRSEEWRLYEYDGKFYMHLFRLLDEGKELATTKQIVFPLANRKFYKEIREHKYTIDELENMVEQKIVDFRKVEDKYTQLLPKKANVNKIEKIIIEIERGILCQV